MAKILITGATGFIGANIVEGFMSHHDILALMRTSSHLELVESFKGRINWINIDKGDWKEKAIAFKPEILIHSAWIGVGSEFRNDWKRQAQNIDFLIDLFEIADKCHSNKFIAFGSQAEYGNYSGIINEEYPLNPVDAYGTVKIICSDLLKYFCNQRKISWYWLRLFSFFGKGQSENWLIPSVIKSILKVEHLALTHGEQKYAYLYVGNLIPILDNILCSEGDSGIYNVSGEKAIPVKKLIIIIRDYLDPSYVLNFGEIPYRINQAMHMEGSMAKYIQHFGIPDYSLFSDDLYNTIEYYRSIFNLD